MSRYNFSKAVEETQGRMHCCLSLQLSDVYFEKINYFKKSFRIPHVTAVPSEANTHTEATTHNKTKSEAKQHNKIVIRNTDRQVPGFHT